MQRKSNKRCNTGGTKLNEMYFFVLRIPQYNSKCKRVAYGYENTMDETHNFHSNTFKNICGLLSKREIHKNVNNKKYSQRRILGGGLRFLNK